MSEIVEGSVAHTAEGAANQQLLPRRTGGCQCGLTYTNEMQSKDVKIGK